MFPRIIPVSILLSLIILLVFKLPRRLPHNIFSSKRPPCANTPLATIQQVTNRTLGFEHILAIGLPERSDKRDALALASQLSGFDIQWLEGMKGEQVVDKALPWGVDRVKLWENNLGSWRGHMNAVRRIVEEGYATALIMEDDMDWDVRIKGQLIDVANGAIYLYPSPSTTRSPSSPYGDDWDLIWLGHCGEVFPEVLDEHKSKPASDPDLLSMSRKYTITPDPTVPHPVDLRGLQNYSAVAPPHTRWVHVSGGPICSFAYALSQRGARKVLYDLSVEHLTGPFDNALAGLCRWGRGEGNLGMQCVSVTPPLFVHHKARGKVSADSDIQGYGGGGEMRETGWTENIVWSTRMNLRNLMMGRPMESQFRSQ